MMKKLLRSSLVMATLLVAANSMADTIYSNVQCWAEGNSMRIKYTSNRDTLVSARLFLKVASDPENPEARVLRGYIGHVSGAKFLDGQKKLKTVDFYSQFQGDASENEDQAITSSLSPRSRKYKDSEFFRFNELKSDRASYHDGGDMNGTLVLSKDYQNKDVAEFKAHYIFQHGDHTGGTLDMTCSRD